MHDAESALNLSLPAARSPLTWRALALISVAPALLTLACDDSPRSVISRQGEALEKLHGPEQIEYFDLRAAHTEELIATGLGLRPIAQLSAPLIEGEPIQATDLLFSRDRLIVSYNFKGDPHRGAVQVIDIERPDEPMLIAELLLPRTDLNQIRLYQGRYLFVAAGDSERAATLEVFDLAPEPAGGLLARAGGELPDSPRAIPQLIASLDLPSRQATSLALHEDRAFVTTGDDGGVVLIDISSPASPTQIAYQEVADARYVELLSDEELLLVRGGEDARILRRPLSWLAPPPAPEEGAALQAAPPAPVDFSLDGLTVGAPSWGFLVDQRFHLSADEQGLMTFSLSGGEIRETGTVPTAGDANAGAVSEEGRLAFLANGQEGLVVLDVQEGHPTQLLARFDTPGDHGSANAVAVQGGLVALADGLGGVKLLEARLLRRGGRVATFLLNFADDGFSQELVEALIHDAFVYTTPTLSPRVLYVLDDANNGEHPDDPPLTQSILEQLAYDFQVMDEPIDGLSPADVADFDLVWFANPGWYVEDAASVDTLISFSAQGGGIVLQGDDMTHRRTGESLLSELTGLRFQSNGARTCGVRTNNQEGARYEVQVDAGPHPLIHRSAGERFSYGDDIDHSEPMGIGETVLAWATLQGDPSCALRTPVIVAWEPNEASPAPQLLLSVKRNARLGEASLALRDGDVASYTPAQDHATRVFSEGLFRNAEGAQARNEELDAIHYLAESGRYLLSTRTETYLGQPPLRVRPGDVVEYDPALDEARVVFSQDLFRRADGERGAAANIDAISQTEDGLLYLSTTTTARLGAPPQLLSFGKGDLILYDLALDQASIVLTNDALFRRRDGAEGATGDLDAVHALGAGRFLFSTFASESIGENQLAVGDGDLVLYDQATRAASLYLPESIFRDRQGERGGEVDLDACALSE